MSEHASLVRALTASAFREATLCKKKESCSTLPVQSTSAALELSFIPNRWNLQATWHHRALKVAVADDKNARMRSVVAMSTEAPFVVKYVKGSGSCSSMVQPCVAPEDKPRITKQSDDWFEDLENSKAPSMKEVLLQAAPTCDVPPLGSPVGSFNLVEAQQRRVSQPQQSNASTQFHREAPILEAASLQRARVKVEDGVCFAKGFTDLDSFRNAIAAIVYLEHEPIHTLDISESKIGLQGFLPPSGNVAHWGESDSDEEESKMHRSAVLAIVYKLLLVPRRGSFEFKKLIARNCGLADCDASILSHLLRRRPSATIPQVALESMDLSNNQITDTGADLLKKAIKYNPHIVHLNLEGNPVSKAILDKIAERVYNNSILESNLNFWQRLVR